MDELEKDWIELEKELDKFQTNHKDYVKRLEEVESLKISYLQQYENYKKKLKKFNNQIEKYEKSPTVPGTCIDNIESIKKCDLMKSKLNENLTYMRQISDTFPRRNGIYLKIILGSVCVSILNKEEKWKYKEEYEKFKYVVTTISMCLSFLLLFLKPYRVLDAVLNFLLVWYYCTLTIRESILVINGSKINGWWQAHHFITTVCVAIFLIWPDSELYQAFRQNFNLFCFYTMFVQLLQYYYQKGCLYRLRALGEKEDMDTTVEGFQIWMTRGLSFLLPFLIFGYFWELYNSYLLFNLMQSTDFQDEWQVPALSLIFFILFAGNMLTTYKVIRKKVQRKSREKLRVSL